MIAVLRPEHFGPEFPWHRPRELGRCACWPSRKTNPVGAGFCDRVEARVFSTPQVSPQMVLAWPWFPRSAGCEHSRILVRPLERQQNALCSPAARLASMPHSRGCLLPESAVGTYVRAASSWPDGLPLTAAAIGSYSRRTCV